MIRIGVVSDAHGCAVGLETAVRDLRRQGVDAIIALGDMVQGGSEPARVVEIVRDAGCPVVMGNSDHFVLTGEASHPVSDAQREVRDWTRAQLGADGLAFVAGFAPTVEVPLEGARSLLGFHGSPRDRDEVLLPETDVAVWQAAFADARAAVLAGGHVHLQWMRTVGDALFFNPGSVGVTYHRHAEPEEHWFYPLAEFAVVVADGPAIAVEMCRIPLDVDELQRVARASGRPYAEEEARGYLPPGARGGPS